MRCRQEAGFALDPGDNSETVFLDPAYPRMEHIYNPEVWHGPRRLTATLTVTDDQGATHTLGKRIDVLPQDTDVLPNVPRPRMLDCRWVGGQWNCR